MAGFRTNPNGMSEVLAWKGHPDDDVAHQKILDWLHATEPVGFLDPLEPLEKTTKGNLGEFITLKIGKILFLPTKRWPSPRMPMLPFPTNPEQV